MAISFPRDLPSMRFSQSEFRLEDQQSTALTGGGNPNAAELGPRLWRARFTTAKLGAAEAADWEAWLASLRGGLRMFKAIPPGRRYPRAHAAGFGAFSGFSGTGTPSAIGSARDAITISGLPSGLTLSAGDYLSVPGGSRQLLHLITEGASVSAGALTVGIEPVLRADLTTGITVRLASPWCEMVLVGAPSQTRDRTLVLSIGFEARQVLI